MTTKASVLLMLVLALIFVNTIQCTVTISSFQFSETELYWTTPYVPSTTLTLGVETSGKDSITEISDGYLNIRLGEFRVLNLQFTQVNYFDGGDNYLNVTMCIPVTLIEACGINMNEQSSECELSVTVNLRDGNQVNFNSKFLQRFPKGTLTAYQNIQPPQLNSFSVTIHPDGPLATFELSVSHFGIGMRSIVIDYSNGTAYSSLCINTFQTINGLYYSEVILPIATMGLFYTIEGVTLNDFEYNEANLDADQMLTLYGVSNFTVIPTFQPTASGEPLFTHQYEDFGTLSSNVLTNLLVHVFLIDPTVTITSNLYNVWDCYNNYQNSTYIIVNCPMLPNQSTEQYFIAINANNLLGETYAVSIPFQYNNNNNKLPQFIGASFSVDTIYQLKPFFLEMNYTFTTWASTINDLYIQTDDGQPDQNYLVDFLVSGNAQNGTMSIYVPFDCRYQSMSKYQIGIFDSKGKQSFSKEIGPETTAPTTHYETEFFMTFNQTVFDLSLYGSSVIPFLLTSVSPNNQDLIWNSEGTIQVWSLDSTINYPTSSGATDSFDFENGEISRTNTSIQFDTFIQLTAQSIGIVQLYGQTSVTFLIGSAIDITQYLFTQSCFDIKPVQFQETLLVDFSVSPSPTIQSSITDSISFSAVFKGDPVVALNVTFYESKTIVPCSLDLLNEQSYYISTFTCTMVTQNMETQLLFIYLSAEIKGTLFSVYNLMLQQSSFPSVLNITGPVSSGMVPSIESLNTQFNYETNNITLDYTISTPDDISLIEIQVHVLSQSIESATFYGIYSPVYVDFPYQTSGTLNVDLCSLQSFLYAYQSIGLMIRLVDTNEVFYDFPMDTLVDIDPSLNLTVNPMGCDFNGPRLVNISIVGGNSIDTSTGPVDLNIQLQITDDISGFQYLIYTVKSIETSLSNYFYYSGNLTSSSIVSGNIRNGIYEISAIPIGQYTTGQFRVDIEYLSDQSGNQRWFTYENINIITQGSNIFNVTSSTVKQVTNTQLTSLSVTYNSNQTLINFGISVEGTVSFVYIYPMGTRETVIEANLNPINNQFQIINYQPSNLPSGLYYISICMTSFESLSTTCLSYQDLLNAGLPNSFIYINDYYQFF
ncbi:hypothetical protein DLAC_07414 [Tieghemostelium lacteum]|uniref:DUF7743 domain-containing protein n=1 Tax=Tieghemostelium lacteum TaxID=361077 RepID=A0A151ZCG9_TIELA|nr:hypothetical protein DLAC_07414 [Tieghemostelium lacteum]|eukprot:KYQ91640.1 hypothetical protein DLAC_07414 [Tieghemostelium lacteum]